MLVINYLANFEMPAGRNVNQVYPEMEKDSFWRRNRECADALSQSGHAKFLEWTGFTGLTGF